MNDWLKNREHPKYLQFLKETNRDLYLLYRAIIRQKKIKQLYDL